MKRKIIFFIDSLGVGGAEKVLVGFANALANKRDAKVVVVSFYDGPISKEISNEVAFICINKNRRNTIISRAVSRLKKEFFIKFPGFIINRIPEIHGANVYVSFLENRTIDLVSNIHGEGDVKKIAWIHTDIKRQDESQRPKKTSYNEYSDFVFVSEFAMNSFRDEYRISDSQCHTIYNGVDFERIIKLSNSDLLSEHFSLNDKYSVSVGRLCEAKDYMGLIDSFHEVKKHIDNFKHYIIGDGPLKMTIQNYINHLGLDNNIILLGAQYNPYPYIKNAKVLVHNSKWEGFGVVLVEAAILDTPVIIRSTPTALELYRKFNIGRIYNNTQEFYDLYTEKMSSNDSGTVVRNTEKNNDELIYTTCSYDNMVKCFEAVIND